MSNLSNNNAIFFLNDQAKQIKKLKVMSSIVIRRVSLGGVVLFDGRGLWGPTKNRVQKDPFFLKTPKVPCPK